MARPTEGPRACASWLSRSRLSSGRESRRLGRRSADSLPAQWVPRTRSPTLQLTISGTVFSARRAMLVSFAAFGALRGVHDMKTPLWVAGGMNALNVALDPILIFGLWGFPALGVAGAALASSASQWVGAFWGCCCRRPPSRLGRPCRLAAGSRPADFRD